MKQTDSQDLIELFIKIDKLLQYFGLKTKI
jgi:hypothetical protein